MKKNKLVSLIFIIVMCPSILCGCWNYKEIDRLAIVAGIAIDKNIITNKYIVTAEVITTQNQGASSNTSSELYSSEADSVFSAVRNMIEKTGLTLFWSHASGVIVSESVAKEGVIPVIDFISRGSEIRSNMWMIIAKGNSAAEILKNKVKLNEVSSFHVDDILMAGEALSQFTDSRLYSFAEAISSEGKSATVAAVKNELSDSTVTPHLSGSAIFKTDKLVGYLNSDETQYMLMIKNKTKEGLITLKNISGSDTSITLEIFESRTKLTPIYNNGKVSLIIDIYQVVGINEVEGTKDFMNDENLKILQNEAEKKIETEIQCLISKLQKDYHSDVLGFSQVFEREKPKVSENFKKSGEDISISLKTEVNVHLKIKGSGKLKKPIYIEK